MRTRHLTSALAVLATLPACSTEGSAKAPGAAAATPAASPRTSAHAPAPTQIPASAPSPATAAPAQSASAATATPDAPCSGSSVALSGIGPACDCVLPSSRKLTPSALPDCGGPQLPYGERRAGLVVTVELAASTVRPGEAIQATLRWRNTTDAPMPVTFLRDTLPTLRVVDESGKRLPIEGRDRCAILGAIGSAQLRSVTLPPGGEVHAEASTTASREKRKNGGADPLDCDTVEGSPLAPGRYAVELARDPAFRGGTSTPARLEVVGQAP